MELKDSECVEWKYVNYMKNIFQSIGLDYYYYGNFNIIGSHPNSDRRADFEKLIFVFKIIFPTWYCKLSMF
jgi:hypothetical protein